MLDTRQVDPDLFDSCRAVGVPVQRVPGGAGDVTVRNVTAVDPGAEGVVNGRFDGPGFSSMRSTASRLHVGDLDEVFVQTVSSGDDVYGCRWGRTVSESNIAAKCLDRRARNERNDGPPYGTEPLVHRRRGRHGVLPRRRDHCVLR
jgi:hypothetical protein